MFQISLISEHSTLPDQQSDLDTLKNDLLNNLELQIVDSVDTMMATTVGYIKLSQQMMGDTIICHEDNNVSYQLLHGIHMTETDDYKHNLIATLLAGEPIYGNAVLIRVDAGQDLYGFSESITIDNLANLVFSKMNFTGYKLNASTGTHEKYLFAKDPLELCDENTRSQYKGLCMNILGMQLIMFVNTSTITGQVNTLASIMCRRVVNDDVYIIIKDMKEKYINMTDGTFDKLIAIMSDYNCNLKLTEVEENTIDGRKNKIINSFTYLEERYEKFVAEHQQFTYIDTVKLDKVVKNPLNANIGVNNASSS